MLLGYSAVSAFQVIRQMKDELNENSVVVVLFHDHGSRYVGKVFNDDWMRERGFLNEDNKVAKDLVSNHENLPLLTIGAYEPVTNAIAIMRKFEISQLPVVDNGKFVGSVDDTQLVQVLIEDNSARDERVIDYMQPAFPIVQASDPIETISKNITKENGSVLVELGQGKYHILTRHDIVAALG